MFTDDEKTLNDAFLTLLSGREHPAYEAAEKFLNNVAMSSDNAGPASFYIRMLKLVDAEIEALCASDKAFAVRLENLAGFLANEQWEHGSEDVINRCWSVFFPEGVGAVSDRETRIEELRKHREVQITSPNPDPITDPAKQIVFTSNALLTIPFRPESVDDLPLSDSLKKKIRRVSGESQQY